MWMCVMIIGELRGSGSIERPTATQRWMRGSMTHRAFAYIEPSPNKVSGRFAIVTAAGFAVNGGKRKGRRWPVEKSIEASVVNIEAAVEYTYGVGSNMARVRRAHRVSCG